MAAILFPSLTATGLLNREVPLEAALHLLTESCVRVAVIGLLERDARAIRNKTPVFHFGGHAFQGIKVQAPETVSNADDFQHLCSEAKRTFPRSLVLVEPSKPLPLKSTALTEKPPTVSFLVQGINAKCVPFSFPRTTPVAVVVSEVARKFCVSPQLLRLVNGGRTLQPSWTLAHYAVNSGSIVFAALRLRGGMAHVTSHLSGTDNVDVAAMLTRAAPLQTPLTITQALAFVSRWLAHKPASQESAKE